MPNTIARARVPRRVLRAAATAALVVAAAVVPVPSAQAAAGPLTITPLGWNVVGLDSNTPTEATAPARYAVGARVCNTGSSAAPAVSATWAWTSANAHISVLGAATKTPADLAAGSCRSLWWTVDVERVAASQNTARGFQITASGTGVASVSTPTNREIYVEKLISQNRNSVTGSSGPTSVYVGSTYTWTFTYDTGTFNQVEAGAFLDPSIFEIRSVSQNYSTGGANDQFYKDACGWINDTTSGSYRSCTTNVKAGGTITSTVVATVTGTGTSKISPLVLDFSGSSYHYNTDYPTSVYALTVTATNPPAPTANADTASTGVGVAVDVDVLGNDVANAGSLDVTTLSVTGAAAHGTATVAGGVVHYVPTSGYSGTDTFTYRICTTLGVCATAVATITVSAPPVATPDSATVPTAVATAIDVLGNDSSAAGFGLSVTAVGAASHGTATLTTGVVGYTSAAGFHGTDSFTYTISDGHGGTAASVVTVTVTNSAPTATDDSTSTTNATAVTVAVLGNDSDPNGDTLAVTAVGSPAHGTAVVGPGGVVYTPVAGYKGTDSFAYTVSDGQGGTATATVTVSVANALPVAADDAATTPGGTPVDIAVLGNDIDPNGDALTVTSLTAASNGTATLVSGVVHYVPAAGFRGVDTVTYRATDGAGTSAVATVTITVDNTPPATLGDAATTHSAVTVDVLGNDSDPNGDSLVVTSVSSPSHGTAVLVAGQVLYTPAPGFSGADSFTYTVSDGHGGSSTGTVSITVTNTAPVTGPDTTSVVHGPGATVSYDVLSNDSDPDADALTLTSVSGAAHGIAVVTAGLVSYTPTVGFVGDEVLTYSVSDGHGGTATGTLTVHVTNTAPTAGDDSATTTDATAVVVPVLGNDADADGDALTILGHGAAAHGTVTANADGTITYLPDAGFRGADSFGYTVSDGHGGSATATVLVNVADAAPVARDDSVATPTGVAVVVAVLGNDTDTNGDTLQVTGVGTPSHGTATVNADGTVTYAPVTGFKGADSFGYTISDSNGGTASAVVSVVVADAGPVAADDAATTPHGTAVTVDVLANDTDPNPADTLSLLSVGAAGHGTTAVLGTTVVYTPDAGFVGTDTFTYIVSDFDGGIATGHVTVQVIDRGPVAGDDSASTGEGVAVVVNVLGNDSDPDGDPVTVSVVGSPGHGTAVLDVDGTVVYTPATGFVGTDTFAYSVTDGLGATSTAVVTVTVTAAPGPGPDPDAASLSATVGSICVSDAPYVTYSTTLLGGAAAAGAHPASTGTLTVIWKDSTGRAVATYTGLSAAGTLLWPGASVDAHGSANDWPGWVPVSGRWVEGPDGFEGTRPGSTLELTLGGASTSATVAYPASSTACAVSPRLATTRDSASTRAGRPVTITVLGNDTGVDGGARTSITRVAAHGSVVVNADGTATYVPVAGFSGSDSFTYTVTNANGLASTATVTVTVAADAAVTDTDPEHPQTGSDLGALLPLALLALLLGGALRVAGRRHDRAVRSA